MPDIAITIAFEGDNPGVSPPRGGRHWDEGAVMDYMWPEFAWAEFKNGFTNRNDTVTLLGAEDGVRFGSACDLAGGYKKGLEEKYVRDGDVKRKKKGIDRGSATWPVFCLLNSDRELEGRFGDPKWAALSLSINSCNGSKLGLSPEFEAEWNATGTGRCNYTSEFVPPAINVWFRFPREDWAKSGRLKPAQGGMLRDDQKWTWFVYETLSNEAWNRPITSNIDLRYNKVQVHGKKTLYDGSSGAGVDSFQEQFFSFYSYTSSPSGTSGATFANPPYFLTLVRIAPVRRDVSVRYQNVQEVISEISGSWSAALLVGYFIICALDEAVRLRIRASARATATAAVANTAEANGAATGFSEPTMLVLKPEDVEKLVEQRVKTLEQKVEALAKALVMHVPTSQALSEQNEPEPGGQKASETRAPVTQAVSRIFK